ncbi:isochorismate synthase [Oceanobacillus halotolerans]|uniref:isochorismate synthase n=1 Tax=Oceanobacillus halotolerans TaxID=2663380 RepID=UPI0013DB26D4|nr:isochorismate synthase [Oceanobacillus halotolerans]
MIEVQEQTMEHIFQDAINQIGAQDDIQLVAITKKIDAIEPVQFFANAKQLGNNRMFWTSPKDHFTLASVGNAYDIIAEEAVFDMTEDKWTNLLQHVKAYNPYQAPGTGVVIIGGMSFDPEKQSTDLWNHFHPSHFTVPAYLLTKQEDTYYFTITRHVKKTDDPNQLAKEIRDVESNLLENTSEINADFSIKEKLEVEPAKWKKTVQQATEMMKQKKAEKIVLARELQLTLTKQANIAAVLQRLMATQETSYVFAFEKEDRCFVGATPERLVKLEENQLFSACLAGTAPRGKTKEEDEAISEQLWYDSKNRQEHDYVVQMIKQAVMSSCEAIEIPEEPIVYSLRNMHHLFTPVAATLKEEHSIFQVMKKLHPTPALGGAPRNVALDFIREQELLDRGWYGAPIGWLDHNENGEFAVAIRSSLIQGDHASLFAGCGIVADSDPETEYEETNIKFSPMLAVLGE